MPRERVFYALLLRLPLRTFRRRIATRPDLADAVPGRLVGNEERGCRG